MNEVFEKLLTATDEEIMHDLKEALDDVCPESRGETLDNMLTHLQEGKDEANKQLAAIDRLIPLVHRYREEVLKK